MSDPSQRTIDFWPGNPVSYTTTRIELFCRGIPFGFATGFVMKFASIYALVTNWHVVSGFNPITGACLSPTGGIPTSMRFHVALIESSLSDGRVTEHAEFREMIINLYEKDDLSGPIWLDAKDSDNTKDYCVIPLARYIQELGNASFSLRSIEGGNITLKKGVESTKSVKRSDAINFYPPVGYPLFIVGYPAGLAPFGIFPIWKGGTIASEPLVPMDVNESQEKDLFLVDGLTKYGMSGAPVVSLPKRGDVFYTSEGTSVAASSAEPILFGVYAGREGVTGNEADLALGRVWKVEAVERLFVQLALNKAG